MKKFVSVLSVIALSLCLSACGGSPVSEVSDPPAVTSVVSAEPSGAVEPEYALIDSSKYVRDGKECVAYRVEIGDGAAEEDMRAVFDELSAVDDYYLHTVWFYGLASDVEAVGAYTVGELEEETPGGDPVFTPAAYDAETIAALRDRAGEEPDVRSIPSPSFQQEALVPDNLFSAAPAEIFSTPASENGLGDRPFYAVGTVEERAEMSGYDTIRLSTEAGEVCVSGVTIPIGEISVGDEVVVYFIYSGWSETLGIASGVYVYHE